VSARLRLFGVVLAVLLPALVLARWLPAARRAIPGVVPISLPSHLGPWAATEDKTFPDWVLNEIRPDAYLIRRYEAVDRAPIEVYVGLYATAPYGGKKSPHHPKGCYPAGGWEIMTFRPVDVPLGASEKLRAKLMEARKVRREEAVLYWFQPAGRWPRPPAVENVLRLFDAAIGRPQYAFVRLASPSNFESGADRALLEFTALVAPAIRNVVEGVGRIAAEAPVSDVGHIRARSASRREP
jgi:EpsI family protein